MHRFLASLLLVVASTSLPGQSLVLPAGHDAQEGNRVSAAVFSMGSARHQWVIGGAQLAALGQPWSVSELWFRRDMSLRDVQVGGQLDVELWASATTASCQGPSEQFASNRGLDHRLRCTQRLALPPVPASGSIPAPWDESTNMAVRLVLNPPLTGTENLCLELVTRVVPGVPVLRFDVDAVSAPVTASSREIGTSCAIGALTPHTDTQIAFLIPGSSALLRLSDVPTGRVALSLVGFSMQSWSGVPLPLPLDQAGAPGCSIYTDWLHLQAAVTAAPVPGWYAGEAFRRFQLPLDPTLLGGTFYSQWLILEPGINPLGMVTTHGLEARLASAFPGFAIATVESFDPQAASGRVLQHFVPVLRLVP